MSKIGKGEWLMLYLAAGGIDVLQWALDITGIGAGFNELADPLIGVSIAAYFQIRGVSMIRHAGRIASLLGLTALEEVSVSVAPAWIIDIWYMQKSVAKEDAEEQAAMEEASFKASGRPVPRYSDGVGRPESASDEELEFNRGGYGRPRGADIEAEGSPTIGSLAEDGEASLSA
ncbi:hypothetical protein KGP36_07020 [Patescibacteria group bacterium]|nr:hypothetical protein [Patescibacteria group bacterium]